MTIYQERNLIPYLTVGENILLGDMPIGVWYRAVEASLRARG